MSDELKPITMPHSRGAEEAVLGAVIIDPEGARRLTLQPEDFYIQRNAWIYRIVQDQLRKGTTPDYLTICSALQAENKLGEVGGSAYILELINSCPSAMNAEAYAAIVRERARRRFVIETANKLATIAFDLDSDMTNGISTAMDRLSKSIITSKGARHISEFVSLVYDEIEAASKNPSDILGVPTGFLDWDKYGGLTKQTVMRLSGDPGVGKSLLSMQVLANAAERGYKGALYQMEMTGKQVVRRQVSARSKITTHNMRTGHIKENEWDQLLAAIDYLSSLDIYISDASDMTTGDVRVDCQRLKDAYGLDVIVIDYEGLFCDQAPNELERQNLISQRVKAIAKDIDVAIISIGDMLKTGIQGSVRGMGAQAGTGRSLHDRDEIVTLTEGSIENLYDLKWDKNREGSKRTIQLVRTGGIPMFESYAKVAAAQRQGRE